MELYERTIPVDWLPEVRAKVAKLNKRAAKVGVPALVLAEGPAYVRKARDANGRMRAYEISDCVLSLSAPIKFAGYYFVARLENIGDDVLIAAVPGMEVPVHYREQAKTCDHCRKDRTRKFYYLVKDDTGTHLRVGSSCLRDFLGTDAEAALFVGGLSQDLDEYFEETGQRISREPLYYVPSVLAVTAAVIRERGWISKAQSGEDKTSTATDVGEQFWRKPDKHWSRIKVTEPDRRMAQQALAWAKVTLNGSPAKEIGLSDYEHNLRIVSNLMMVKANKFGLLCSLVPTAQRALNRQAERACLKAAVPSTHIGAVGQRRAFSGKVVAITSFDSQWGATHYFKVATAEGLVVVKSSKVWWTDATDRGSEVKFLATVKKHGEYKGTLETTVNRAVQE